MTLPVPGDVAPGIVPTSTSDSVEAILRAVMGRLSEDQRKTLYSATISEGGMTVQGGGALRVQLPNGVNIFYAGPMTFGAVSYQGIIMRRADGTSIFYTFPVNGDVDVIAWRFLDQFGNEVVASDALTGGLARPWIPIYGVTKIGMAVGEFGYHNLAAPAVEVQLWEGRIPLASHPFVEVDGVWGQASGSNTTTYKLNVGGVQVGTWTVGGGLVANRRGPYDISAYLGDGWVPIEITAQSTGSGQVACHVKACSLRQT